MNCTFLPLLLLLLISLPSVFAQSLKVPAIFSDNMILQRETPVPVWGKSKPGSVVAATINSIKVTTTTDKSGNWFLYLPKLTAGSTYTLSVKSEAETLNFKNILAGDVYFAGGQSNMQYKLPVATGGEDEVQKASFKNIRFFTVPKDISYTPKWDINISNKENVHQGKWVESNKNTASDFSAVAYFFAKKIHLEENIPVGIINISWGGTTIETHMSAAANRSTGLFINMLEEMNKKKSTDTIPLNKSKDVPVMPSCVFNAMINPVIPYAIKGFLWYQGEGNWNYPYRYRNQFKAFINDLRVKWRSGELPFYFVIIPNMGKKPADPMEDFWSVLRESQLEALTLPNTGAVLTFDVSDGDLHPKDKKPVGERLAYLALKYIYGKNNIPDYPQFNTYKIIGDSIKVSFSYAPKGLEFKNDSVKGFAIAGEDMRFYWANAIIKGSEVWIYNSKVKNPKAVRYAWGEDPPYSLFNKEGLPAMPFRTDKWEVRRDGLW